MFCHVCQEHFDEHEMKAGYDRYPYGDREEEVCTHGVCPICGADDLSREAICVQCGEEDINGTLRDGFCHYCHEELEQTLDWIVSMLSPAQCRFLADHPEWIERSETLC